MSSSPDVYAFEKIFREKDRKKIYEFVEKHGKHLLHTTIYKPVMEVIYADQYAYKPIHVALQEKDMDLLAYLKNEQVYPIEDFVTETDFNSRADQFMGKIKVPILDYARQLGCNEDILVFLENWIGEFKKKKPT